MQAVAFDVDTYCPAPQLEQLLVTPMENWPGAHAAQDTAPALDACPGGQAEQLLAPDAEYRPPSQSVHRVALPAPALP